jgi:hypothetical protein
MAKTPGNKAARKPGPNRPPDQRPLNPIQATRLAGLTGLQAGELAGLSVAAIKEKFAWQIDLELLLFRRICGQVVKRDPVTGEEYPVPYATVHVYDTDCNLLGFFPPGWKWGWFYPLFCNREELDVEITDECGRFCIFVPRFEIDWILHWRRLRFCFPDIFIKPNIRDILDGLELIEPPILRKPPLPDPPPFLLKDGGLGLQRLQAELPRPVVDRLAAQEASLGLGSIAAQRSKLLDGPAFPQKLPPPLPAQMKENAQEARQRLAASLNLEPGALERFDPRRFAGPFRRCVDIYLPEWVPILDVPDITFEVTQDVNGDGAQEVIYSEGMFDVRWGSGPIPDVTLEASPSAISSKICDTPDVPCENQPAILFAGLMPLVNPPMGPGFHDASAGYALRPNRPHPSGLFADPLPNPDATAPYTGTLQLYGCNHIEGAIYYRLRYSYNGDPSVPFTGLSWPLHRLSGGSLEEMWTSPDSNGWYEILPDSENWFPDHLLLEWNTHASANGVYALEMDLGDGSKNVIATSAPVNLVIDNTAPNPAQFVELQWRVQGGAWSGPISLFCPQIHRPLVGGVRATLEFMVTYQVVASHLRSVEVSGGGCGGSMSLLSALSTAQHWHTGPGDNSVSAAAIFQLTGDKAPGAYSFSMTAASRAFNPSGGDGGHLVNYNYDPVYNYVTPSLSLSIIDA